MAKHPGSAFSLAFVFLFQNMAANAVVTLGSLGDSVQYWKSEYPEGVVDGITVESSYETAPIAKYENKVYGVNGMDPLECEAAHTSGMVAYVDIELAQPAIVDGTS